MALDHRKVHHILHVKHQQLKRNMHKYTVLFKKDLATP